MNALSEEVKIYLFLRHNVPSTYLHVNYDYLIVLKALEKSEI
jgi:hypothetical protein